MCEQSTGTLVLPILSLLLSINNIGPEGARALGETVRTNRTLTELE